MAAKKKSNVSFYDSVLEKSIIGFFQNIALHLSKDGVVSVYDIPSENYAEMICGLKDKEVSITVVLEPTKHSVTLTAGSKKSVIKTNNICDLTEKAVNYLKGNS